MADFNIGSSPNLLSQSLDYKGIFISQIIEKLELMIW